MAFPVQTLSSVRSLEKEVGTHCHFLNYIMTLISPGVHRLEVT